MPIEMKPLFNVYGFVGPFPLSELCNVTPKKKRKKIYPHGYVTVIECLEKYKY